MQFCKHMPAPLNVRAFLKSFPLRICIEIKPNYLSWILDLGKKEEKKMALLFSLNQQVRRLPI